MDTESPYWRAIKSASEFGSIGRSFKDRFYWLLKPVVLSLERLEGTGPSPISRERVARILQLESHNYYIDHITLNVGPYRLEPVSEILLSLKGFSIVDYFFPLDVETGMISLVIGNRKRRTYFAVNEGLDGWTPKSRNRMKEFAKYLHEILPAKTDKPVLEDATTGKESAIAVTIADERGKRVQKVIPIHNRFEERSHISEFVQTFGEGIQHVALETDTIISKDDIRTQSSAEELFYRMRAQDILPLESTEVYRGKAGKKITERQHVFQFFTKTLHRGFFFEFINRTPAGISRRAERGHFVTGTVMKLYRDKERDRKNT